MLRGYNHRRNNPCILGLGKLRNDTYQGPIINDWSGEEMSVDDAVRYVLEYGKS